MIKQMRNQNGDHSGQLRVINRSDAYLFRYANKPPVDMEASGC